MDQETKKRRKDIIWPRKSRKRLVVKIFHRKSHEILELNKKKLQKIFDPVVKLLLGDSRVD